jgi:uncharacterized membrane protein YsdA (DUF1294 family)
MSVSACVLIGSVWLIAVNAVTVTAFASDKRRAVRGEWRIRESTLLGLALLGGSPGAAWARARFRHKTRKRPFATILDLIVMLHAGLLLGGVIGFWRSR